MLVYGYGNPGRQDDGLGPVFVEKLDEWLRSEKISNIVTDSNYQLNIEDAEIISGHEVVLFVDASIEEIDSFILTKVEPSEAQIEFTMHAVSCAFVLDLCTKIYGKTPETYLLHIKGYEFAFKEGLTQKADHNLQEAFQLVKSIIKGENSFRDFLK